MGRAGPGYSVSGSAGPENCSPCRPLLYGVSMQNNVVMILMIFLAISVIKDVAVSSIF